MGCVRRLAALVATGTMAAAPGVAAGASGYPGVLENDEPPTVAGDIAVGGVAIASPGQWSGQGPIAYAYQWEACPATASACTPIPGATGASYPLSAADQGNRLVVAVTASNASTSYAVASAASMAVAPAADQVQAALLGQLMPRDATLAVAIGVQTRRGYRQAFDAPVTGRVTVDWYWPAQPGHLPFPSGGRGLTLVAKGATAVRQTGPNAVLIRTTARGHQLVKRSRALVLTAVATVTPPQSRPVSARTTFTLR